MSFLLTFSIINAVVSLPMQWLCRAIVWDDIVLGSNKTGEKLPWGQLRESHLFEFHYPGAIFRLTIVWG